jgi:hypothetical protein
MVTADYQHLRGIGFVRKSQEVSVSLCYIKSKEANELKKPDFIGKNA